MGTKKIGHEHRRMVTQNNSGSYSITLPIQLIREVSWQKGQRVTVRRQGKKLIIEDWER
ncbi:MAG: AbrB/MazE/SpoVT family DNA-binding domain-containing protein [Candidatus Saccharibacteria bacterium]|nr:AbrB/MazE/SpoVT family DNA-binding domain-containing protein [Candidatus Saccharibacteria bacterium]